MISSIVNTFRTNGINLFKTVAATGVSRISVLGLEQITNQQPSQTRFFATKTNTLPSSSKEIDVPKEILKSDVDEHKKQQEELNRHSVANEEKRRKALEELIERNSPNGC